MSIGSYCSAFFAVKNYKNIHKLHRTKISIYGDYYAVLVLARVPWVPGTQRILRFLQGQESPFMGWHPRFQFPYAMGSLNFSDLPKSRVFMIFLPIKTSLVCLFTVVLSLSNR